MLDSSCAIAAALGLNVWFQSFSREVVPAAIFVMYFDDLYASCDCRGAESDVSEVNKVLSRVISRQGGVIG